MKTDTVPAAAEASFWARNRALVVIMMVNFVSLAGFGLMFPVLAVHGRDIGAAASTIAGAVAAFSFGQFLSSPIWGRISDTHGRRAVLIGSLMASALLYLLHIFVETPLALILARFGSGLATGSFSVAFAVASDISTRETRTKVMGIVGAGFSLGFIFGPAIGGLTASLTAEGDAFDVVCLVGTSLALAAAAMTWAMLPETRVPRPHVAGEPRRALAMLAVPGLAAPVLVSFFAVGCFAKMESVLALFAGDVLGLRPLGIGMMFGGMGTISTVTQLLVTGRLARLIGEQRMLLVALGTLIVGMFALGAALSLPVAAFGLFFTSVAFALMNPALSALTSFAAPADAQGAALGMLQSANSLGQVIGPAIAGILYDLHGPASPFLAGGAILLVLLLFAPFVLPRQAPHR